MTSIRELLSRPRSQNSRHVLGWEICVRVWEGRGRGSSVHVYRTCRRISRYGFCLSGGGVGLESRMTSCYLIKLTGCSSDVFENTSKRKKKFHFIGVAYRSTHLRPKKPRFCAETLYTVFPRVVLTRWSVFIGFTETIVGYILFFFVGFVQSLFNLLCYVIWWSNATATQRNYHDDVNLFVYALFFKLTNPIEVIEFL